MDVQWWSVDFKTGLRGNQVRAKEAGRLSRIIGIPTEATVSVRVSDAGSLIPGVDEATQLGRSLLVAVDADGDNIVWAGLARRGTSDINEPWEQVSLDTIERYLFRRHIVSEVSWTDADPAQVAVDALAQIADLSPLTVSATMTGNEVIDGFYNESDNKRIGDVLTELSGLSGGIEWTVDPEWVDADHTQMRYVVRIAPRLGTAADGPAATQWRMPGCVTGGTFIRDYSEETGANDVVALSSGEGDSKPRSTRYEATELLDAYARFERRFTPAASIASTQTLDQFAEAEIARTRLGLTQLSITATLNDGFDEAGRAIPAAPRVNRDWWMGDDIDVSITSPRFPARFENGEWVAGYERRLRTVGWDLDLDARTIIPRIREAS